VSTYLISRPGRPLHLAVRAYDRAEHQPGYQTCRFVPLCGQDRGAQWTITGPWAEKWDRYKGSDLCSRCFTVLDGLIAAEHLALRTVQ